MAIFRVLVAVMNSLGNSQWWSLSLPWQAEGWQWILGERELPITEMTRHQAAITVGQVAMRGSICSRELPMPPSQVLSQAPLTVSLGEQGALDPVSTDKALEQSHCTSSFQKFSNQTGQDEQLRDKNGASIENAFEKTRNSIFWWIFSPFSRWPLPSVFLFCFLLYHNICRSEEIVTSFCSTVSLKEALQQTRGISSSPAWRRAPLSLASESAFPPRESAFLILLSGTDPQTRNTKGIADISCSLTHTYTHQIPKPETRGAKVTLQMWTQQGATETL